MNEKRKKVIAFEYFEKGISSSDPLTIYQIKRVFLITLKDFFYKKISIDEMSYISNALLNLFGNSRSKLDSLDSELVSALEAGSEIDWYSKNQKKSNSNKEWFEEWVGKLKKYYNFCK